MSLPARMRHVQVGHRAGAGEPRVDVDDLRAARLGLHHPLEADRVRLGEVGALDDDAVGVLQVLQERGRAAAAERRAETGDGRAVADPRLVLHLDHAERGEQLLDEVVLLVVQGRPAEAGDAQRAADPDSSSASSCQVVAPRVRSPGPRPCPWRSPGRAPPSPPRAACGSSTLCSPASPVVS